MEFLQYTRTRSPELADYLQAVASSPLSFEGLDPLKHSSHNHIHLWKLEYLSDAFDWIDVDYRVQFATYVLEQWRRRLKGLPPYRQRGYRIYVYEDLAPTISVVAETDVGFPYAHRSPTFVDGIREIMRLYEGRSWRQHFASSDCEISEARLLLAIERNCGSIGRPSALRLCMQVGKLRTLIINMGLGSKVNAIRKQFRRRPADFTNELPDSGEWRVFERILPAHYR